jgi:glutamate--cysteine ligase
LVRQIDKSDLVSWFFPEDRLRNLVGLEIECGLVRPDTGRSVSYEEPFGSKDLLERLLSDTGSVPVYEGADLIGLQLPDRSTLTLEMAGAIEYSSRPVTNISEAVSLAKQTLVEVARVAERLGLRLLTGGMLPFDSADQIKWAPKPRTKVMRRYFEDLGEAGSRGDQVMGLTLSTQVNLDALTAAEYLEKLRVTMAVSPFVAALFAGTPGLRDDQTSVASQRMLFWRRIDPVRCQDLSQKVFGVDSIEELVDVLTSIPMIYRRAGGAILRASDEPFGRVLADGFEDGSPPSMADWESHLRQVWPTVRPRRTLETRLPDGPAWMNVDALAALWVGLVEEQETRRRVLDVVGGFSSAALDAIAVDVAAAGVDGLSDPVREVCVELLGLAKEGLGARVQRGIESPSIVSAIDRIQGPAAEGRTMAVGLLDLWNGPWQRQPARYVSAMAVPTEGF